MFETIFLVFIFLAILIVGHEFGHFITAKLFGMRVDEFGIGFPPRIASWKKGETEYTINALPFGGFVRIYGESKEKGDAYLDDPRSFRGAPLWKRAIVIAGGVVMNVMIAWIVFAAVFMIGIPNAVFIETVQEGTPAAEAGFAFGDEVKGFTSADEFTTYIAEHAGEEISVTVERSGEEMVLTATPREEPPVGEGRLGVAIAESGSAPMGFFAALYEGFFAVGRMIVFITSIFFGLIGSLFGGEWEALEGVSGPVGIFNAVAVAGGKGIIYILQLLGLISVNLAVLNILPFPALDGGRLVFLVIERFVGRARILKVETLTNAFGFMLLLALMVIITIRDIINVV
jgi:regulator of sigma E protease